MSSVSTTEEKKSQWEGGKKPYEVSYGKLMMWFFLISDAFTFSTLLIVYGVSRFATQVEWANPEAVFTHFPGVTELFHMHPPLAFVGMMTFVLIASSVTMVLAVEAGHRMDQKTVEKYMILTIIGGFAFVACQGYEWFQFITGTAFGSLHLTDGTVVTLLTGDLANYFTQMGGELEAGMKISGEALAAIQGNIQVLLSDAEGTVLTGAEAVQHIGAGGGTWIKGANLVVNQYSQNPLFGDLFFFITGFHGTHVFSGVVINFVIYMNVKGGTYEKRGHYEMVEKVGLYWHFVDLVWVFVFTLFYLI